MKNILAIFLCLLIVFSSAGCKAEKASSAIDIYIVSRDLFHSFLAKPSIKVLELEASQKCTYSKGDQWHIRNGSTRFKITRSLIDFVGDTTKINNYLSQNGINSKVDNVCIIDTPNVPLTLWIKTDEEDIYITINNQNDEEYIYELYSNSDYTDKYDLVYASLNINGEIIESEHLPKIYSNYADVPFLTVLKSLGATSTSKSDCNMEICFNEKQYMLNFDSIELYEIENRSINLFHKDGGTGFVYSDGNEIMIDSFTLNTVLRSMGISITITCDKTNKIVKINCA